MTENQVPAPASSGGVAHLERGTPLPAAPPPSQTAGAHASGWTGGRITAVVIGGLLLLIALGLLGGGATALWVVTQRDDAGYVTTDVQGFSTSGSALVTESIDLGSPGVGWLYSEVVLGEVRIRVTPSGPGPDLFVGIGPTGDVTRFLAGVGHTHISDFWDESSEVVGGGAPASAPGTQDFWVASTTGPGTRTLTWDPPNGSWSVVVMNADGGPGIDVGADLGATLPALPGIAIGSLVVGALVAVGGVLLIVGAIRRAGRARAA